MAFIAAPVAVFFGGGTVGALAGSIAVGVVTGAVMGAATAFITGGDILEGALKGALIGGVSSGVLSGLGMATGLSSASSQLESMGLNAAGTAYAAPANVLPATNPVGSTSGLAAQDLIDQVNVPGAAVKSSGNTLGNVGGEVIKTAGQDAVKSSGGTFSKLFLNSEGQMSDATGKILAGGVEGIATAYATPEEETPESQSEYLAKVQNMNVSGDFQRRTANIQIPEYWKSYTQKIKQNLNPSVQSISPASPGVSYA